MDTRSKVLALLAEYIHGPRELRAFDHLVDELIKLIDGEPKQDENHPQLFEGR